MKFASIAMAAALLAAPALTSATVITLTFEGVGNTARVNEFYNGGTDSVGNSGTNYGISFGSNSLGITDEDAGGTGNIANEPTPNSVLFFLTGTAVLNYAPGFTTGFSFYYSSSRAAQVLVYDGLDATGNLIGTLDLSANFNSNCTGDPNGDFCHWDIASLGFAGTARSIDFGGTVNQIAYDNITFGSTDPRGVPEPSSLALAGLAGLGLLAARRPRRR